MGEHPATSALNGYCQAHDVKNLFVTDGGAFRHQRRQESHADDHGADLARVGLLAGPGEERKSVTLGRPCPFRDATSSNRSTMTAIAGSVLRVIPLEAAEYAHRMVRAEKAPADNQVYAPKFFSAHFYKTLQSLCQTIIPADDECQGRDRSRRARIHRPDHQRKQGLPDRARRRTHVARQHLHRPLRQRLSRLHGGATERNS